MIRTAVMHLPLATDAAETRGGRGADLSVDTRHATGLTIVVVSGRVTVDSSPHLRAVLHDAIGAGLPGVTIDFTEAPYLDTSALATLLEAAMLASQCRVALRVPSLF
jgi:anti-anti-sigma regulatory factor